MLLRFNQQVRIAEEGIHIRHFEKGGEYELVDSFAERILEVFPDSAIRIKREDPKIDKKLVIKTKGKIDDDETEDEG